MKPLSDPGLARTQRWMQAFIMAGGDHQEALQAPQVASEIPPDLALGMVLPSATLAPIDRVGIYRNMYLARLGEALESDYPGLLRYLGEDGFYDLVSRYVDNFPSRSYTLNRLGDHLPDFIATLDDLPKRDFLHDLAKLELALTEVFDADESPVLKPEVIAAVPPETWEKARLKPVAALRLLSFRYPVSAYLGAVDGVHPFPVIRRKNTWVAACRREYRVGRLDLERKAFDLLSSLCAGTPVGEAVVRHRVQETQLFEWFRDWSAERFFQSVTIA